MTDPRAYVFAIIDAWRAAVKRRDIFASPGTRYGDPGRGMLDGATWQASKLVVCRALNRSLDAETEIAGLAKLLDGAYRTVADRAASNPDLRFETVDGKTRIVVTPLDRLEDTESLHALRPAAWPQIADAFPARAGMNRVTNPILQRTSRVPEQALNSDAIRAAMLATMLAQGGLWEAFRQRMGAAGHM